MVWLSVGLLAFLTFIVVLNTQAGRWSVSYWRTPRGGPTYTEWLDGLVAASAAAPGDPSGQAVQSAVAAAYATAIRESGFHVFSHWIVFSIFATFLLPLWCLSFATEGLGREREAGNLIWLLTRPLSRPSIYLAKLVAVLPWSLGLSLGGFAVLCWAAGPPGWLAFRLYWPAVLGGVLAFTALFHLLGAILRRAAVVAILYSFFLETVMGNLPGYFKRLSISYYVRCSMFDRAAAYGVGPDRPHVFLAVSGTSAWLALAAATILLVGIGMIVFSRREYLDVA
jgi:ABC-type transport system involved in multi-copper enzyme maturation permease subunit